jgi:hypothetical protein
LQAIQTVLKGGPSTQAKVYEFFSSLPLNTPTVVDDLSISSLRSYAYNYHRAPNLDHRIRVRQTEDGRGTVEKVAR